MEIKNFSATLHVHSCSVLGRVLFAGAILANNHQWEMFPALEKLLSDFQKEGIPKWKQMKCIELAMALLAEDLIGNGIVIDIDNGNIEWPMGGCTESSTNEGNKRKGGKSFTKNSTGPKAKPSNVFGH